MNDRTKRRYDKFGRELRGWQSASHIERAPQREKKTAPPAGGTTPPKPPGT